MTRCSKCQGCLVPEIQEYPLPATVRCIQCGWRPPCTPVCPPIEPSVNRQWTPGQCEFCLKRSAVRGKPYCWPCHHNDCGIEASRRHGAKIAAGMKAARERA